MPPKAQATSVNARYSGDQTVFSMRSIETFRGNFQRKIGPSFVSNRKIDASEERKGEVLCQGNRRALCRAARNRRPQRAYRPMKRSRCVPTKSFSNAQAPRGTHYKTGCAPNENC